MAESVTIPAERVTISASVGRGGKNNPEDVAKVVEDHQPLIGDTACAGGTSCLLLVVERFPDTNTTAVSDGVDAAVAALRPGLTGMEIDSSVYRPAAFVEATWENLEVFLGIGTLLLLLVLVGLIPIVGADVDANGRPIPLGNETPDFQMSWNNTLNLSAFEFGFLFDWKKGGEVINLGALITDFGGTTEIPKNITPELWRQRMGNVDCIGCHQLGQLSTRTIPSAFATDSLEKAWMRRVQSGQAGQLMIGQLSGLGLLSFTCGLQRQMLCFGM